MAVRHYSLAFALALAGCANAPPMGKSLPRNFPEANVTFNRRVTERFPVGSSEGVLKRELNRENFTIGPVHSPGALGAQFRANREGKMGLLCDLDWDVYWAAEAGKITIIYATYFPTCV